MPEIDIARKVRRTADITLTTATDTSTVLRVDDVAGGAIAFGTMLTTATTLQVFGAMTTSGPFVRVYYADGWPADITLSPSLTLGRVYALPDATFALPHIMVLAGTTVCTGAVGSLVFKT